MSFTTIQEICRLIVMVIAHLPRLRPNYRRGKDKEKNEEEEEEKKKKKKKKKKKTRENWVRQL
jgi:hypothetical protein